MQRDNRGSDIHASDLTSPLKAYWQRIVPKPPTEEEVGFWLAGRGHHYFLVYAMTGVDDSQEESLVHPELGIHYSPDLRAASGEFKTSRRWSKPQGEIEAADAFKGYVRQCRIYAVAENKKIWNLYVLFLMPEERPQDGRRVPDIQVYTLHFTDEELERERKDIIKTRKAIQTALKKKDPSKLPLCEEYQCVVRRGQGRGVPKKVIPTCKWFTECKPQTRYEDYLKTNVEQGNDVKQVSHV